MKFTRFTDLRAARPVRPALSAIAVATALAAAAGIAASPADAKPRGAKFKHPDLKHGVLTVEGTKKSDKVALRLRAGNPAILEIDVGDDGSADFSFETRKIETITVNANAGDDLVRIDESSGSFTDEFPTTIDGGVGDDNLIGGSGAETLLGGEGNDSIDGGRGSDVAFMGAGDDTFVWDPGEGSDIVEGQAGLDTMQFNAANVNEKIDLSANGSRLRLFRDIGSVTMDTAGVERVNVAALGGADLVTVDDLSGTDVVKVNVDLAATGGAGDGQADQVIVNGSNGNDTISVAGNNGTADVSGLAAAVHLTNAEPPNDTLTINALAGSDTVDASGLAATSVKFENNGGDDADVLTGSAGDDRVNGGRGNDLALLGVGDDAFVWSPGDGSDTVEGQAGDDTMLFNGANVSEQIDLSANGNRLRLFRDIGNVTMDTAGVEQVDLNAIGGTDTLTVNDLSGTDVVQVNVDLAATGGGGDGEPDHVIVAAPNGDDVISVGGANGAATVLGLAASVNVSNSEPANDTLTINALGGDDVVDALGLAASSVALTLDGGAGDDVLIGSAGNDTMFGREGDDVLLGGPGQDVLDGGPGDNILIQG